MTPPETLPTARLVLRRPRPEDATLLFNAYGQDEEVAHYLTWRPHAHLSDSEAVIEGFLNSWRDGSCFNWLLFPSDGSELLGALGVRREAHRLEMGYVLARPYWGHGLMGEAVTALLEWAFREPSVFRVGAVCDIDNQRSARLLEKAGLQQEGILRAWSVHPNISATPRDCYSYATVRSISTGPGDHAVADLLSR